jgi:molecular chaperone DnaJ
LRYDLEITLEEAYRGANREISFQHLAGCETCHGSGARPGTSATRCDRCGGSGIARTSRQTPLGSFVTQSACPKCGGEGEFAASPCETCRGHGRVERTRTLTVKIPAGVDEGSRIRIASSGEGGTRGGPPGDLYVYLSIAQHPRFRRDGGDLFLDMPISFTQAALGGSVAVDSLDGSLELAVVAGTQTGSAYRLRGRGMPHVRGGSRGDLLVTVHVAVPSKLSRRELLEEYAELRGDKIEDRSFFERVKDAFKVD